MALHQLDADEQEQILECMARLVDTPPDQWPAKRLNGDPPTYLVRINDDLRAFVNVANGKKPEVEDIVYQGTLDFFAKHAGKSVH